MTGPIYKALLATASLLLFAQAEAQSKVVAYVPNWGPLVSSPDDIDYSKITHINLAFENPVDDLGNLSFEPNDDKVTTKAHAKGVKVLISIGGGSASTNDEMQKRYFSLIAADKRTAFAAKLLDYVTVHGFDGLDVDLEGPSINPDYGAFIEELSKVFRPAGKLLTAALSQGYGGDKVPDAVFPLFDFVNVMAYDGAGPWNKDAPGQHSSFDMAKEQVAYWLGRGLPAAKCVLGVPFYGYGFGDAYRNYEYPFKEIVSTFAESEKVDQVGSTIWYNGIPTIQAKAQYVVDQKLGGVMIWSLDSDAPGEKSLLAALWKVLRG